ncbi:MAG: hypothetical protein K6F57_04055 [Candidatus Saccharibacteria bacterium]|nr:hypothetical protein [Candidatus Saccharibacteria bacterium]
MDGVIRNTKKGSTTNHASSMDHRRMQKSSTLNRKFVKKPTAKPKINNTVAAASKGVQRQGYNRTILQKGGSVRLQPIHKAVAQQRAAQGGGQQVKVDGVEKIAVRRVDIAQANVAQTQAQKQQAQRRAVIRQVAQKRSGDVYIKNAQAVAAKRRMAIKRSMAEQQARGVAKPLTAQQMKDRAIQQALSRMNRVEQGADDAAGKQSMQIQFNEAKESKGGFFRGKKFAIAAGMAVITIALLGYLVYLNMPDLSARVAAMHAGIEKSYPSYVPVSYRLDGLVKEDNGRITMNFKNDQGHKFTLQEEKSSWDSAAVLANYVKKNWGADYSIAKGQGLTIYISGSNATWVNGGVLYIIMDPDGHLNSSDLHDIAVSL